MAVKPPLLSLSIPPSPPYLCCLIDRASPPPPYIVQEKRGRTHLQDLGSSGYRTLETSCRTHDGGHQVTHSLTPQHNLIMIREVNLHSWEPYHNSSSQGAVVGMMCLDIASSSIDLQRQLSLCASYPLGCVCLLSFRSHSTPSLPCHVYRRPWRLCVWRSATAGRCYPSSRSC
jgi:hypothetical protein